MKTLKPLPNRPGVDVAEESALSPESAGLVRVVAVSPTSVTFDVYREVLPGHWQRAGNLKPSTDGEPGVLDVSISRAKERVAVHARSEAPAESRVVAALLPDERNGTSTSLLRIAEAIDRIGETLPSPLLVGSLVEKLVSALARIPFFPFADPSAPAPALPKIEDPVETPSTETSSEFVPPVAVPTESDEPRKASRPKAGSALSADSETNSK